MDISFVFLGSKKGSLPFKNLKIKAKVLIFVFGENESGLILDALIKKIKRHNK
jgi:hypothetical protein